MPIRKQTIMVARRMKISMARFLQPLLERRGFAMGGEAFMRRDWIGRGAEPYPLDDEQQQAHAADWNRQICDAHRQEGEVRDRVVPGHLDQTLAPYDHEKRNQRHQELHQEIEQFTKWLRRLIGEIADVHMQV